MTPLQIEVLLHCYTSQAEHPQANQGAAEDALTYLLDNCLIETSDSEDYYSTTDRGDAFVNHICSTSLPVKKWEVVP